MPHSCGTERQQQINLPIVGGKFPAAHGSCCELIGIMAPEWRKYAQTCGSQICPKQTISVVVTSLTTIGKHLVYRKSLSISMFRCRLSTRCLFTFTKPATPQNRCGASSLDKASTMSRFALIPKRVKPCTASSLAVTVFSSAADRQGRQSEPAARIRTDLGCRT